MLINYKQIYNTLQKRAEKGKLNDREYKMLCKLQIWREKNFI